MTPAGPAGGGDPEPAGQAEGPAEAGGTAEAEEASLFDRVAVRLAALGDRIEERLEEAGTAARAADRDRPRPTGEAEPGLMGLVLRAGDRLAYTGDELEARVRDDPSRAPNPPPPAVFVGSFSLTGRQVPWNMHWWNSDERRLGSLLAAGVASLLVVVGIVAELFVAPGATGFLTLLLVGVVLAFAFQLAVFLTDVPPEVAAVEASAAAAGPPAEEATVEPPEEDEEPLDILTLKCSDCGEVFDVEDHGDRPLQHTCPGCGSDGEIPADELPDPEDLRGDEPEETPEAPAGEIPQETGDPIPEFELDEDDEEQA